jgi:hypothetical protein
MILLSPHLLTGANESMAKTHFLSPDSFKMLKVIDRRLFSNPFLFYFKLIASRFFENKIIMINGSPFGHMPLKVFLFMLGYNIYEYTPFPELPEMMDRWHHRISCHLNKLVIRKRILIDEWQVRYSKVSSNLVLNNYV